MDWSNIDWSDITQASLDTLSMSAVSLLFTVLLGLPLGVLLFLSGRSTHRSSSFLHSILSLMVNVLRSIPFIILLIALIPFTLWLVGTSLGVLGTIPSLVIGTTPFFARLVENTLRDVDKGVIEACQSMGFTTYQLIRHALIPEALPGLVAAGTVTAITIVSYASMSGIIGGGGLGDLALRYGYQRFQLDVMIVAILILILIVQILQWLGDYATRRLNRK